MKYLRLPHFVFVGLYFIASGCGESKTPDPPPPPPLKPLKWSITEDHFNGVIKKDNGVYRYKHTITPANNSNLGGPLSGALPDVDKVEIKKIVVTPPTRTWTERVKSITFKVRVDNPDERQQTLVADHPGQPIFTLRIFQGENAQGTAILSHTETNGCKIQGNGSEFYRIHWEKKQGIEHGDYYLQIHPPTSSEPVFSTQLFVK